MFDDEGIRFRVVANHQEQYSIWPDFKELPAGWAAVGPEGTRDECLDYIERVWTDMRPKVLRDRMAKAEGSSADLADDVVGIVRDVLGEHEAFVKEYEQGKPELYGWFVARVLEKQDTVEPDVARAALDAELPAHNIPSNYA